MKEKEVRRQSNLLLIVLDGFGISGAKKGNAITLANTKNLDLFKKKYASMMSKKKGDAFSVMTPKGKSEYKILEVE